MQINNHIILTGYMGAGKSTIGNLLAERKGRTFVDLDLYIETEEKKPIPEIFADFGEPYFRESEAARLKEITGNKVIATGGGIFYFKDTVDWMKKNGTVVYLHAPFEELYSRISEDLNRPVVMNNSKKALEKIYNQRHIAYQSSADIVVSVSSCTVDETIENILRQLK